MTAAEQQEEGTPTPPRRTWHERLRALPPRMWGLIIAPVIPVVAATLVTGWLDGAGEGSATPTSTPAPTSTSVPRLVITGAERREDASLSAYLGDAPAARQRYLHLLGCEGAVFAVSMEIKNASAGEPQLTWSLRQKRGHHAPWDVPSAYDGIRRVTVRTAEKLVWVPLPGQRESWLPGFQLYEDAADIPADPADTWEGQSTVESIPLPPEDLTGPCEVGEN